MPALKKAYIKEPAAPLRWMSLAKGVLTAIILTMAAVFVFALTIKMTNMAESVVPVVNQIIKILGISIAAWIASVKCERPAIMGMLAGAAYILMAFLIFSLIDGVFVITLSLLADVVMGIIIGMIAAAIASRARGGPAKK
ncbi:MAG: TIGR04086 family membrane protein [Christensenellales bacterium]|jgi:putative membrane protein (TIGR04086 family)